MAEKSVACYERAVDVDPEADWLHEKLISGVRDMPGAPRA
jgi:hypothetical protein